MEYAEAIAPGEIIQGRCRSRSYRHVTSLVGVAEIERSDNVVLLIAENLTELAPNFSNPKVAVVEVPMPDHDTRRQAAMLADARLTERTANAMRQSRQVSKPSDSVDLDSPSAIEEGR